MWKYAVIMAAVNKFFGLEGSKKIILYPILVILLAIPITVILSQQQQEIRQRAAEPTPIPAPANLNILTPPQSSVLLCNRCSNTYKYCRTKWESTQSCTDIQNVNYQIDCSCTQGALDCSEKQVDTSSCSLTQ